MKITLFVLSILFSQLTFAMNLVEDTAILALKEAKHSPTGTTVEHGGMIFQRNDKQWGPLIEYLEPSSNGKFDHVQVIDRSQLLSDDVVVATYHIHLCMQGYYHDLFSIQDVVLAVLSNVPEFMLDECSGDVHEFDPKTDKVYDTGREAYLFGSNCEKVTKHLPTGRIIGNIGETEQLKEVPGEPCVKH